MLFIIDNWLTKLAELVKQSSFYIRMVSLHPILDFEVRRTDISTAGGRPQETGVHHHEELEPRKNRPNPIVVLIPLTLVMKASYRNQDPSSQSDTLTHHTWPRSQHC